MSEPAAILASSVSVRTLADGTLRLSVDIEPNDAQAAFSAFGKPGSPVAVALIRNEAAVAHDRRQQEPAERKPLALASKVALTCKEESFWRFLAERRGRDWHRSWAQVGNPEACATLVVRQNCGVTSRSEIVEGSTAAERWQTLEADYYDWQRGAQ